MLYYQQQGDGLLAWAMGNLQALLPEVSDERMAAFFGGLVLSTYALLQFFSAPFWGRLSDRIGRRPVLLMTTIGNLLGYLVWVFSGNFLLLLIGRLINGFAAGNISTLTAAATDLTTPEKRTRIMGAIGATFGAGFMLGPAIGGIAFATLPDLDGLLWGLNRFSSIALVSAFLALLNILFILKLFPETRKESSQPQSEKVSLSSIKALKPLSLAYFIFMVSFTGMELGLIFMVEELLGFRPGDISWLFVAIGLTSIIIQGGVVRRMSAKVNDKSFTVVGLILFTGGMLLLASISIYPANWLAFLGAIVVSLGFACVFPATSSWVSKLAPDDQQGAAMGRIRSLGALARIVGPLGCAALYFAFGAPAAFIVFAALLVIPLVLTVGFIPVPHLPADQIEETEIGAVAS